MKRKQYLLLFAVILTAIPMAACHKKEEEPQKIEEPSRIVKQDDIGLQYTAPQQWKKYEETNILPPFSTATPDSDIFAEIEYDFVTAENLIKINSLAPNENMDSYKQPICKLLVVPSTKKDSEIVKEEMSHFSKIEEVAVQENFIYYALSEYNGDLSSLSKDDIQKYEEIKSAVPDLVSSIVTYPFSPDVLKQKQEKQNNTLSFITKTLEGDMINSSVFGNYQLTMVNFWGSYGYEDFNETSTLQSLHEKIKESYPSVNFLQVVIDVPDEIQKEEDSAKLDIASKAKTQEQADFISIRCDTALAGWITNHLEGLPTTIFVNNEGVMIGEQIQGTHSLEEYLSFLDTQLQQME